MTPSLLLVLWTTWTAFLPAGPGAAAAPGEPTRLVLRNGTVYMLKEPPRISGTRVVFTTSDGRLYSMDQSEIDSIGSAPQSQPPGAQKNYNSQDSRELGAIARQQRDAKGRRAEVAPKSARRKAKPTAPRPRPTPRPKAKAKA